MHPQPIITTTWASRWQHPQVSTSCCFSSSSGWLPHWSRTPGHRTHILDASVSIAQALLPSRQQTGHREAAETRSHVKTNAIRLEPHMCTCMTSIVSVKYRRAPSARPGQEVATSRVESSVPSLRAPPVAAQASTLPYTGIARYQYHPQRLARRLALRHSNPLLAKYLQRPMGQPVRRLARRPAVCRPTPQPARR